MRRRTDRLEPLEFPTDVQWLNVEKPLSLRDLRKKVVLLNFWTSACINCMHVIPDLKRLMRNHAPELVVIGVHSPRFAAERDTAQLRLAVRRHEIDYPVINDRDMRIWQACEVDAWPTSLLIDPRGRIVSRLKGEGVFAKSDETIFTLIRDAARSGDISHEPIALSPERERRAPAGLTFPAGILADERSRRLFISDSGANRVVVTSLDGEVSEVIGGRAPGLDDGSFEDATFHRPQGTALDGNVLYVADTGNHAIRRIDFSQRTVRTIAGTGHPARALMETGDARGMALKSPWDVTVIHHRLYITMAGAHQIWRLDLRSGEMEAYAGAGSAGLLDGTRGHSLLAQPSGLATDDIRLFFTDVGTSAIRWVYLPPSLQLGTWVGQGVFEYGDRDGRGRDALLQYPLGLTHHLGDLYVADTYNHKIKRFNPRLARVDTLAGTGEPGPEDGESATFNEPRALDSADGRLWIADTNNHRVRVLSLDGGPVSTLILHPDELLRTTDD